MYRFRNGIWGVALLLAFPFLSEASPCQLQPLLNQREDVATIVRLEQEWTRAYLRGDTDFELCLLTPDFTEIMRTGEIKVLKDELALAAVNKGKNLKIPGQAKGDVLLHGNVAVAYGTSTSKSKEGQLRTIRYADYYIWEGGVWHAFFAQQTALPKSGT
jgi:hypothetical protein